jgi:hypothetical protein
MAMNTKDEEKLRAALWAASGAQAALVQLRLAVVYGLGAGLSIDTLAHNLGLFYEEEQGRQENLIAHMLATDCGPRLSSVPPAQRDIKPPKKGG